ncbi:MAG: S41 family peptidase [Alphaproteobacteria bacterium]|nr:S41 family peptidase [Alphaproteobacteria bacterium]
MKRLALVVLGMGIGFMTAVGLLPSAQGANNVSAYRQFDLFSDAFERVRDNYVRPVQDSELINGAIEGMVSSLDPHSSYMDAKAFADMQIQTKGEFGGVGIEVTQEDGLIKVISPIDDTPAAKAGLKTGDYIAAIDGNAIQGVPLNDAIDKMRGPVGTKVTLTILRQGEKKPFDVQLMRAVIHVDSVKWHREGDVGYVRISAFNEETDSGLQKAVRELKKQIGPGLRGWIIDLRNDPGGLLDQAVMVSDDFLVKGEIVSTRGRHPEDTQRYDAKPGDITDGKPVVVLINGGTASASEIVAGALQDHKRATVIGMTSFGKGSVQTIIPLGEGGGALRLTTARYYTPSGRSIQAEGITPNIAVAEGNEQDEPKIERTTEADLPGHLAAEDVAAKKKAATIIRPPQGKKYDDFQLSYAQDFLDGKVSMAAAKAPSAR